MTDAAATPVQWTATLDGETPYTAQVGGATWTVRINDFPAEPLYTLLIDGAAVLDLEDWPAAWTRPAPREVAPARMGRQERKVAAGAARFLQPGEQVLAALVVQPRGYTQRGAGARELGRQQIADARVAAAEAGLLLTDQARPAGATGLVLTSRRLLTLGLTTAVGLGLGGEVQALLGSVPLAAVEQLDVRRLVLGHRITITARGHTFALEANAAAHARGLQRAFTELTA